MKQHTQCWSKFSKVSSPQGGEVNSQKSDRLRVAKMNRMPWIAGLLSCRSFCPKEPLIIGLFCEKWSIQMMNSQHSDLLGWRRWTGCLELLVFWIAGLFAKKKATLYMTLLRKMIHTDNEFWKVRVAKMQRMPWIAGLLNCRSFCPKEPLIIGLFCAKEPLIIGLFCEK